MYRVIQSGIMMAAFDIFTDAWLFASLDLSSYSEIKGPDGEWNVNPLFDPEKPVVN